MKRTVILLLALVAAITSGFAVFNQLTKQIDSMPSDLEFSSSNESLEDLIEMSDTSSLRSSAAQNEAEDLTIPTTLKDDGVIVVASSSSSIQAEKKSTGVYGAYASGVIGNGQTSVLFFYAPWCPECQAADKTLKSLYKDGAANISVYRVDYDTEKDLKQMYGVVRQTTFVVIDGSGEAINSVISPSGEALTNLVK